MCFYCRCVLLFGNLVIEIIKKPWKAIVVVDQIDRHRFNYIGYHSLPKFNPHGVCTDAFGHILVCNYSYNDLSVHLLDENGHFLTSLLTIHQSDEDLPQDVCVEEKHNFFVGCGINNKIYVYKYLTWWRATATDFFLQDWFN